MSETKPKIRVKARDDIELGTDGAKWRHGWVPLNPVAAAFKSKQRRAGGASRTKVAPPKVSEKQRFEQSTPGRKALAAATARHVDATKPRSPALERAQQVAQDRYRANEAKKATSALPGPKTPLPEGRKVTAHEVITAHSSFGEIRDAQTGHIVSSNHTSKRAAAVIANRHNLKTEQAAVAKDNDASRAKLGLEAALASKGKLSPEHHSILSEEREKARRRIAGNFSAATNGSPQAVADTRADKALQGRIQRRVAKHVAALNAKR